MNRWRCLLYAGVVWRRILSSFSRGIVLKRWLPREYGGAPFFVSPESALSYWRWDVSKVDPFLLSMVSELVRPKMTVWDIGANVGLFSFAAAAKGAQVLGVEADTWLADLMQKSVMANRLPVTVLHAAVCDSQGISRLYIGKNGRSANSLVGSGTAQTVITVTLDFLLGHFPPPDVLKIDVEGLEYAVLKAGAKVLERRPAIFCEVTDNHEAIGALLRDARYLLYAAREKERRPLQRPSRDTLAVANPS